MNIHIRGGFDWRREPSFEEFYRAWLPQLSSFGITAEFPADKSSVKTEIMESSTISGLATRPNALRYFRNQESFYSNAADVKFLEGKSLVNPQTGEMLSLLLEIKNFEAARLPSPFLKIDIEAESLIAEAMRDRGRANPLEIRFPTHRNRRRNMTAVLPDFKNGGGSDVLNISYAL